MKKIVNTQKIITTILLFSTLCLFAQTQDGGFELTGTVKNAAGEPIENANVSIQESFIDIETNDYGYFIINVPKVGSILIISAEGYKTRYITINSGEKLDVKLEEEISGQGEDDVIIMPWYSTHKRNISAAVSTISSEDLAKSPVLSLGNALSGRLPGLSTRQLAAVPGDDAATIRIRGMRTLESGGVNGYDVGGIGDPLIIVDGFERNFIELDAEEIESFSVLKDAGATALYGMRAANGVILVTTKRGHMNKRSIKLDVSSGFVTPTMLPEFVDSYTYANLYNEARRNDGLSEIYTQQDLDYYKNGTSPLTHPNVDYYDEFIKKMAWQKKATLSVSGGDRRVRYFILGGYNNQEGLFDRTNENPEFETKVDYSRFNLRSNLDINITDWMVLSSDISGRIEERRWAATPSTTILDVLSSYPSNAIPLSFMGVDPELNKEIFMLGGNSLYSQNPLGFLGYEGYRENTTRMYQVSAKLDVDLGRFVTPGLGFRASYHMDGYNEYTVTVSRDFRLWEYSEDINGNPQYKSYGQDTSIGRSGSYGVERYNGADVQLYYDNTFGNHGINAMLLYQRQRTELRQANYPDWKWESFGFRASYSYANRYFVDLVGSYMGSDNFFWMNSPKELYPAISGSWSIAEEPFMENTKGIIDVLKLRTSFGITGNDQYGFTDVNGNIDRYPSRQRWWTSTSSLAFGTALAYFDVVREGRAPNPDLKTEKARMLNVGIDAELFNNRLSMITDLWFEHRYNIFTVGVGSIPWVIGILDSKLPITNDGIVNSRGIEFSLNWKDQIGKFGYSLGGYVDYTDSKIIEMGEPYREFDNLIQTGKRVKQDYGLVALGLFEDWDDVNSSPRQTFGPYQPGDIKYEDINGDGIIDSNDYTAIGNGLHPRLNYGFQVRLSYSGFYMDLLFQGVGYRGTYLSNNAAMALRDNGNISTYALNRYQTYPDGTTNYETADYPRLTTLSNDNNWRASTFWVKDASYLRLKNAEIGYTFPEKYLKNSDIEGVKLYVNSYNTLTFTNLKGFDPEDTSAGINRYPQTRIFNFGVSLTF